MFFVSLKLGLFSVFLVFLIVDIMWENLFGFNEKVVLIFVVLFVILKCFLIILLFKVIEVIVVVFVKLWLFNFIGIFKYWCK